MMTGLLVALAIGAAPAPHRLEFSRGPGAEACPDEAGLRRAVAERLGRDPFTADGAQLMRVRFSLGATAPMAEVEVVDAQGRAQGQRRFDATNRDCVDLAQATALAVSIAIDPMTLLSPSAVPAPRTDGDVEVIAPSSRRVVAAPPTLNAPPAGPVPPPSSSAAWPTVERPKRADPAKAQPGLMFSAAAGAEFNTLPSTALRIDVDGAWASPTWRVGLGLTSTGQGGMAVNLGGGGSINAWKLTLGPTGCAGGRLAGACLLLRVGLLHTWASALRNETTATTPALAFALMPYLEFRPARTVRLRLQAGLQFDPFFTSVVVGTTTVWRSTWFEAFVGFAVAFAAPGESVP